MVAPPPTEWHFLMPRARHAASRSPQQLPMCRCPPYSLLKCSPAALFTIAQIRTYYTAAEH